MKLYALKCEEGYIKRDDEVGCRVVTLKKASVFKDKDSSEINELLRLAKEKEFTGLRMVELNITEREIS